MKKIHILLAACLLLSCQKSRDSKEKESAPASLSFQVERNAFFGSLKTPTEAAAKLQAITEEFSPHLMSDPKNYTAYVNNPVKAAANLGLYLSDLNYSIAYQQGPHTKELFTAAYELSKVIGIEQPILDFLMKRYSENLERNDSVKSIVNILFDNSTRGLQGTDRERLVGIAMTGYQIENLHLALGVIEDLSKGSLPNDEQAQALTPLFQMVIDQKKNVEITYGFLKSITDLTDPDKNPNYPYYGNAFKELMDVYNRLPINGTIESKQVIALWNDHVFAELNDKVNAIRNKIVSVE